MAAEGGGDYFGYKDTRLDYDIDHDDDDDDDEQEVNTTGRFNPGASSTPYHGGEQHPMKTMTHEQSGLPDESYLEAPLLGDFSSDVDRQKRVDRAVNFIKKFRPQANFKALGPIGFSKKGAQADIVSFGPKGGETQIFKKDGSRLLKSFTDKFSKQLGPSAEDILGEDNNTLREQRQRLLEAEEQEKRANVLVAEKEKKEQEVQNLGQKLERTQARLDGLQGEHGSNIEIETEINRLKQLEKNYKTELENNKKEVAELEKKVKKNGESTRRGKKSKRKDR